MNIRTLARPFTLVALAVIGALLAVAVLVLAQPTSAQPGGSQDAPEIAKAGQGGEGGPLSATQKAAINEGWLPTDQQAYERAKAEAGEKSAQRSAEASSAPESKAPANFRTWEGVFDTGSGPSDATGAIGPTRYIELVNRKFAIYSRTSNTPISTGSLATLVGSASGGNVFDPQVIWDPSTNRFYYVTDTVFSSSDNRLSIGFSKTASPSSSADFCKYELSFGSRFPDYPKLGDLGGTGGLILMGTNDFDTAGFLGSSLYSVTKPATAGSITTCPDASTLRTGAKQNLKNANGSIAATPVPANEIDSLSTGYVVAHPSFSGNFLSVYAVTKNTSTGGINVGPAKTRSVSSYSTPASAPQPGTTRKLDTLDTRNTQAVMAFDPSRGKYGLWTQHTVFGGAGAQVRWYEIDPVPATPTMLQSGVVTGTTTNGRFIFNGAISPDRKVALGQTSKFGDSMVLGYNSSSTTQRPDIRMVSKIRGGLQSGEVFVRNSNVNFMNDFTCSSGVCRWGDYAAATPDPATASTATRGQVWLTSNFVRTTGSSFGSGWGTHNWAARP